MEIRPYVITLAGGSSRQAGLLQEFSGRLIGLIDPGFNRIGVRAVFEFNGNGTGDFHLANGFQVRSELHDAATWRKISMNFSVAVADVDVERPALKFLSSSAGTLARQRCEMSMLAPTAGSPTSFKKRSMASTLLSSERWKGSSSRAIFRPSSPA